MAVRDRSGRVCLGVSVFAVGFGIGLRPGWGTIARPTYLPEFGSRKMRSGGAQVAIWSRRRQESASRCLSIAFREGPTRRYKFSGAQGGVRDAATVLEVAKHDSEIRCLARTGVCTVAN